MPYRIIITQEAYELNLVLSPFRLSCVTDKLKWTENNK
jgi:hypothetical protein